MRERFRQCRDCGEVASLSYMHQCASPPVDVGKVLEEAHAAAQPQWAPDSVKAFAVDIAAALLTARSEGRDAERARVLALIDEDRRDLRDARRPDEHRALSALRHAVADGQQPKERTRG